MDIDFEGAAAAIVAVGALGTAAFGIVEAFGKALVFGRRGLPFVGFGCVKALVREFGPALAFVHGDKHLLILAQQYRDGRASGRAPETIRQAVRLALPMMDTEKAIAIVRGVWGMGEAPSRDLVKALQADTPEDSSVAITLAQRFSLALDNRISAAFQLAEERYQATARVASGVAAVVLALLLNFGMRGGGVAACGAGDATCRWLSVNWGAADKGYPWLVAFIIGAAAVPLAPIAKDLSSALTDALKAWKQLPAPKG